MSDYSDYLASNEWKQLSAEAKKRDGFKCVACGTTESLEAHHLFYRKNLYDTQLDDLVTLCRECHNCTHRIKERWKINRVGEQPRSKDGYLIDHGGQAFSQEVVRLLTVACWRKSIFATTAVRDYTQKLLEIALVKSGLLFYTPTFTSGTLVALSIVKDCLNANPNPEYDKDKRQARADSRTKYVLKRQANG